MFRHMPETISRDIAAGRDPCSSSSAGSACSTPFPDLTGRVYSACSAVVGQRSSTEKLLAQ
jgi:hypothetical protein